MRGTLFLLTMAIVLGGWAVPAAASGPPIPYEDAFVSDSCGFDVSVATVARLVQHEWTDEQGYYRYIENAPTATATLTTSDGSLILPYTGTLYYTEDPDGAWAVVVSGPFVWGSSPQSGFEEQGLWYSTGRVSYSGDHDSFVFGRSTGKFIDLCPLLAS
jgi:hypothetical protein